MFVIDFLENAAFCVCIYLVFYCIGNVILYVFKDDANAEFLTLAKVLIGLFATTIVHGFFITILHTVLVIILIPIVVILIDYFIKRRFDNSFHKPFFRIEEVKILGIHLIVLLSFIAFQLYRSNVVDGFQFQFIDFNYYTQLSTLIKITGNESNYAISSLFGNICVSNTPYHYFELYTNSAISSIFGITNVVSYCFFIIPIFACLQFSSLMLLLPSLKTKIYALPIVLGCVLYIGYYNIFSTSFPLNIFYFQKSIGGFVLLPIIVYLYKKDRKLEAAMIASVLPILNVVYLPIILFCAIVVFLWDFFKQKTINYNCLIIFFVSISIVIYYYIAHSDAHGASSIKINSAYFYQVVFRFYSVSKATIKDIVIFVPIIAYTLYKKNVSLSFFILSILFVLGALVMNSMLYFHIESYHFIQISLLPIIIVLVISSFAKIEYKDTISNLILIIYSLFFCIQIWASITINYSKGVYYSNKDLLRIKEVLYHKKHNACLKGVYTEKRWDFKNSFTNPLFYKRGSPIELFENSVMTGINSPTNSNEVAVFTKVLYSPFTIYVNKLKQQKTFINWEQAQRNFIISYKIDYFITDNKKDFDRLKILAKEIVCCKNGMYVMFF